jgi:hypothetical protein
MSLFLRVCELEVEVVRRATFQLYLHANLLMKATQSFFFHVLIQLIYLSEVIALYECLSIHDNLLPFHQLALQHQSKVDEVLLRCLFHRYLRSTSFHVR